MSDLSGKRVLFICPEFYNYHTELKLAMEDAGAVVDFISEFPRGFVYRFFHKLNLRLSNWLLDKHLQKLVNKAKTNEYDFFFVVRGGCLNQLVLKKLRILQPACKFLMYQWDSIKQNDYLNNINFFDIVKTFDSYDASTHELKYLPLYYGSSFANLKTDVIDIDMAFFGAYHSDRLKIIKFFHNYFKSKKLVFFSHLYITKAALLKRLICGEILFSDIKYFKTYKVSFNDIQMIYSRANTVLDVELSIQSGLSMRTFEVLGAKKRLVTTNVNIENEKFYRNEIILVFDRKSPVLNDNFFKSSQVFDDDFSDYEIGNWLARMFADV